MTNILSFYPFISGFPALLVIIEFFYFIKNDKRLLRWGKLALELMILVVPFILLQVYEHMLGLKIGEGLFTPPYGYLIYALIILCQVTYFYCSYRKCIASLIMEVVINCLLLIGIAVNIMIGVRLASVPGILAICLPAVMLLILMLVHNHRLLIYTLEDADTTFLEPAPRGWLSGNCAYLLKMPFVERLLMLLILCIPVFMLLIQVMVLSAGQPDRW
jgi:hypothetical protein